MYTEISVSALESTNQLIDFSNVFLQNTNTAEGNNENLRLVAGISLLKAGNLDPFTVEGKAAREAFFSLIGAGSDQVFYNHQVHSKEVLLIKKGSRKGTDADGMVTNEKGIVLAVTAADCMPVFLFHKKTGVLGLCHSGWKGTGIAAEALFIMEKEMGIPACEVFALLGPAIGSCCYNVDQQRGDLFTEHRGGDARKIKDGQNYLDLRAANKSLLQNSGVKHIVAVNACTVCSLNFGSYRREGPENYTKMAAYLGWL